MQLPLPFTLITVSFLLALGDYGSALASHEDEASIEQTYQLGLDALLRHEYSEAESKFRKALALDKYYQERSGRSAWYHLGKSLYGQGKSEPAIRALEDGKNAFLAVRRIDFHLDYYLARLYSLQGLPADSLVTLLVYGVLEHARPAGQPDLWREIWQDTHLLLEQEKRSQPSSSEPSPELGKRLLTFLKEQDPFPITWSNEFIPVFFERTAYAREQYPSPRSMSGYDDRGEIHVRLGGPSKIIGSRTGIQSDIGWAVYPYEVWFYDHIHRDAYFTFIGVSGKSGFVRTDGPEAIFGRFFNAKRAFGNRRNPGQTALALHQEVYISLAGQHEIFRQRLNDLEIQQDTEAALEYAQHYFTRDDKMHVALMDTLVPYIFVGSFE